ncbi:IPT/TIG domain-containing protein [Maribellus sediminis]|uniref:IPT/TIG domain-containing protein n=1 Tax=Maribellus sediminis TaxID=2696285 RepID=UPI00143017E2|nr:IPT/TIG domain-containing protein [Maribellus sediminis]
MKKLYFLLIGLILLLAGCQKEESREFPSVLTSPEIIIEEDGVSVTGLVDGDWSSAITDYGFVYNTNGLGEASEIRISLGATIPGTNIFGTKIERNLQIGETYTYKAYVVTSSYVVYGEERSFVSLGGKAPELESFTPAVASIGDTLTIRGKYFSDLKGMNKIYFNNAFVYPETSSDTILTVIVPNTLTSYESKIRVEVAGKSTFFSKNFKIADPLIEEIYPKQVLPGGTIYIKGKGLDAVKNVIINQRSVSVQYRPDSIAQFKIPTDISTGTQDLSVMVFEKQIDLGQKIEIVLPKIESVTPEIAWIDTILTVTGSYLNYLTNFKLGEYQLQEVLKTDSIVQLRIPDIFTSSTVTASFYSYTIQSGRQIKLNMPVITSITPEIAYAGQIITLKGERFFYGMSPSIGTFQSISSNEATLALPWNLDAGEYTIDLEYWYSISEGTVSFSIPEISIIEYYPKQIKRGDTVSVVVENLPEQLAGYFAVAFDNKPSEFFEKTGNILKVTVPQNAEISSSPKLSVYLGGQVAEIPYAFVFSDPWIKLDKNYSMLNGACTFVESAGEHYLLYQDQLKSSLKKFNQDTEEWVQISNTDLFNSVQVLTAFSTVDNIYFLVGGWNSQKISYCYSISNNQWSRVADYPVKEDYIATTYSFVFDNVGYAGNIDALYKYDEATNTWEKKTTLPTTHYELEDPFYFNTSGRGYVGFKKSIINSTEYNEFWEYNPVSDTWSDLGSAPMHVYRGGSAVVLNNRAYIIGKGYTILGEFVSYDLQTRAVTKLTSPPDYWDRDYYLFYENETVYFMTRPYPEGWKIYKIPAEELSNQVR